MQSRNDDVPTKSDYDGEEEEEEEEGAPPKKRRRRDDGSLSARETGLMRDGSGPSSATFVGSASGIHFIRSVYGAIGSSSAAKTSPEANLVPGEDDQLAAAAKFIWHKSEVIHPTILSFDALVALTESYFDLWHPAFPLLHAPHILNILETISRGSSATISHWDLIIVKSVMTIALADRHQTGDTTRLVPSDLIFHTFDDALQAIQNAITRPTTILGLQAVLCVQLFLVSMLRLNVASRLGGLIAQMAFQLGLHRCPARYPSFAAEERQLRKRIWWSAYVLERYICQALGLPLLIHDDDVDVCYLNAENHKLEQQSEARALDSSIDNRMQLLDMLAKHAKLRGSIVELRNKRVGERDRNPETALYLNAELSRWWNEIEDVTDQNDTSISAFHKMVLETLKQESVIMLNRPLLAFPKTTASFACAIESCIGAARSLLGNLSSFQATTASASPLVWPSFTWAAWMSTFIIMFALAENRVSSIVATKNVDRGLTILGRLAGRDSVWPRACAAAIEELRKVITSKQGVIVYGEKHSSQHPTSMYKANQISSGSSRDSRMSNTNLQQTQIPEEAAANQGEATAGSGGSLHNSQAHIDDDAPSSQASSDDLRDPLQVPINQFHQLLVPDSHWPSASVFAYDSRPMFDDSDPLQGFDIPFWLGADDTLTWIDNNI